MASFAQIVAAVGALTAPAVVGISGFGGSGKSTLARALVTEISGSARIRGDDFLDPFRSHLRSTDWDGVERLRLRAEVLDPFRAGRASSFQKFNWDTRALDEPQPVPTASVLLVDVIGLFSPETDGCLDLRIWVDTDLETATTRGIHRDRDRGNDHDALWREVWEPNERDFFARFRPDLSADLSYPTVTNA